MDILKVKEIEEKIINENIKKSDICSLFIGKIDDELLKELKLVSDESSLINKYLNSFLSDKSLYSEDEIKSKYGDAFGNILFSYAIIKDKIDVNNIDFSSDDFKSLNSTSLFFNELSKIEILPREVTDNYVLKFQENLKKYENCNEDKEKYKKNYVFYQNQIIEGNIRLIASIAKRKVNRGLDFLELVNEGTEGMIKAMKKFDQSFNVAFTSYSTLWISSAMDRAIINKGKMIRIPAEQHRIYRKYIDVVKSLTITLKREPTLEEVAEHLNVEVSTLENLLNAFQDVTSLEFKMTNDKDEEEKNVLNVIGSGEFENQFIDNDLLLNLMECLDEEEKNIILYRFLDQYSLDRIGRIYGLTREAVRQRINKALDKMKRFNNMKLVSFFDLVNIPKDDVLRIISRNGYMNILSRMFGESLEKKVLPSEVLRDDINKIVVDITKIYEEEMDEPVVLKVKKEYSKYAGKSLNEILNEYPVGSVGYKMSFEKIRILWEKMDRHSKQYRLMVMAFGQDGLGKCSYDNLTREEKSYVNGAILRWKSSKNNINLNKNILKLLEISKYENDKNDKELEQELMKCLSDLENKIILYHYTYNRSFAQIAELLNYKESEIEEILNEALLKLKKYYEDNYISLPMFFKMSLKDITSCAIELDDEEKDYLCKLFGASLKGSVRKELVIEGKLEFIKNKMKMIKSNRVLKIQNYRYDNKTLYELLNISKEELQLIIKHLNKNTKFYFTLTQCFGSDLLQVYNGSSLPLSEKRKLYLYIKNMKGKYTAENILFRKKIDEIIGTDLINYEQLKKDYLFIKAFGANLDQPYLNVLRADEYKRLINKINAILNPIVCEMEEEKVEMKENKNKISRIDNSELLVFINSFPDDIKNSFVLYFGLYDGISYCVEDISLMLNMNVSAVIIKIKKGLVFLNTCKEMFAKEFLEKNAMKLKRIL